MIPVHCGAVPGRVVGTCVRGARRPSGAGGGGRPGRGSGMGTMPELAASRPRALLPAQAVMERA